MRVTVSGSLSNVRHKDSSLFDAEERFVEIVDFAFGCDAAECQSVIATG